MKTRKFQLRQRRLHFYFSPCSRLILFNKIFNDSRLIYISLGSLHNSRETKQASTGKAIYGGEYEYEKEKKQRLLKLREQLDWHDSEENNLMVIRIKVINEVICRRTFFHETNLWKVKGFEMSDDDVICVFFFICIPSITSWLISSLNHTFITHEIMKLKL